MNHKIVLIFLYLLWQGLNAFILSQTTITVAASQPEVLLAYAGSDKNLEKGQTCTLGGIPVATGGTGSYLYTWSSSQGLDNPITANPLLTANITSSYTLTVIDAMGCIATDDVNVTIGQASNAANLEIGNINVSPNPATDMVMVEVPASANTYRLSLLSCDGKQVWDGQAQAHKVPMKKEINLGSVAAGLYILYIKSGDNTCTRKIVKQ
jgi:hypothetical protein